MNRATFRFRRAVLRGAAFFFASASVCAVLVTPVEGAARDDLSQRWIGTWAASPLRPDPVGTTDQAILSRTGFSNQTLREIVYPHFSGAQVRVRLANTSGDQPLLVDQPVPVGPNRTADVALDRPPDAVRCHR